MRSIPEAQADRSLPQAGVAPHSIRLVVDELVLLFSG
jgi:hypothetical protein